MQQKIFYAEIILSDNLLVFKMTNNDFKEKVKFYLQLNDFIYCT